MTQREEIASREYAFTALFEPAEEGGYTVSFPALRGCITEGETLDEARRMAGEALEAYLESLEADGLEIPDDSPDSRPVFEEVRVRLKAV